MAEKPKLVLVTGKKGGGQHAWAAKWYGEKPESRRLLRGDAAVKAGLESGLDVAVVLGPQVPGTLRNVVEALTRKWSPLARVEEVRVA